MAAGGHGDAGQGAVFAFEDVVVGTAGDELLRGVTVEVPGGGITVVTGPSGAGKTTLLRLCNRLEVASSGRVRYRCRDVLELDPIRLRQQVGMVFQRPALFGGTVRDNLAVAKPRAIDDEYGAALARVRLDASLLGRPAANLSGGEAQRLSLARTLLTEPDVLLLDEPTTGLDEGPRVAFERLTRGLVGRGVTAVWVTHDLEQLLRIADHVIVLHRGTLLAAGSASVVDRPDARRVLRGGQWRAGG